MESEKVGPGYGTRKRRKDGGNEENVGPRKGRWKMRARGVETRSRDFVGKYVKKEFEGFGVFLGKVVSCSGGLYRVDYEDGDSEDLEHDEVSGIVVDEEDFDAEFAGRKKKLDDTILQGDSEIPGKRPDSQAGKCPKASDGTEASSGSKLSSEFDCDSARDPEVDGVRKDFLDGDADSSSDSSEFVQVRDSCSDNEAPIVPAPAFPESSGNIGVPEEVVQHLFSVYTFLRSFSIQLFISPFRLDDLVGALNCTVPNTLMDGIHFALMRALRRHLEMVSSDNAELALKCLRHLDWSLLDTLTWPVYVVDYLLAMGYTKDPAWKGFYNDALDREYYSLSVNWKLMILQVLCDDVMESAEIRAEIDTREGFKEGTDSNMSPLLENGPRRVHASHTKMSVTSDLEVENVILEPHVLKSTHCRSLGSEIPKLDVDAANADQDGNSDECRLCGMDGSLLCCDGCPSAYHPRCTGLSKVLIPDGPWFCLECKAKMTEKTLRIGTGLRGAEMFGTDPYGHTFLGVCNHLLVLKGPLSGETCSRYYNQNDIPKVLQVLYSSVQYSNLYSGICKEILQYWEIPESLIYSLTERTEAGRDPTDEREDVMVPTLVSTPSSKETSNVLDAVEGDNLASCVTECIVENRVLSYRENNCQDARLNGTSLNTMYQANIPCLQKNGDVTAQQSSKLTSMRLCEQFGTESMMSSGSINNCADHSDLTNQSLADKYIGRSTGENGVLLPTKNVTLSMSCKRTGGIDDTSEGDNDFFLYMGVLFKPQAYVNQYFLGDIAATAAANLAVLNSEENQASGAYASLNTRKTDSANVALQIKAFSSACSHFFWPSSEKKFMDVRRERCGWCSSCKASVTCKKGCLLNFAASNAIKGSARVPTGLRSTRNGEGSIPGIAMYILYLEESLHGLTVWPFLSASYRKKWRKQVEQASTCKTLKFLLLELEAHIRVITFSGDWVKLVDDWSTEFSALKSNACYDRPSLKRPGRKSKKQSAISDITAVSSEDDMKNVNWWRGGKISKLVYQRATLPHPIVKKAARQGGSRKIPGICYAEGSDIPKRSRKFTWRSAVEMSMNAPQLALQVRYLDSHVRWSDLVRPEQNFLDGKGAETEASAFRNARICDKKVLEDKKIRYCLDFGNQKHLPSRVLKNIIEVEEDEDAKERFWFSETHIPLFLIKEFEEKAEKTPLQPSKVSHALSKLQRRQLKASRRDIFLYLMYRGDKVDKCSCASCQKDVFLRDAVKCSECEGYCHKNCTISSTVDMKDFVVTCNQCYWTSDVPPIESVSKPHMSHLIPQSQESKMAIPGRKDVWQNGYHQQLDSVGKTETHLVTKSPVHSPNSSSVRRRKKALGDAPGSTRDKAGTYGKVASYGIIWKKRNSGETGTSFRLSNILLRGSEDTDTDLSVGPICVLCSEPYNSDLMYIRCQVCQYWYHADAIQLEESQIFDVVGYRCCKCRRKAIPLCPYKKETEKSRGRVSRRRNVAMDAGAETMFKQSQEWETIANREDVILEEDDPLLFSLQRVEPVTEVMLGVEHEIGMVGTSSLGPQKLQVRRQMKNENEIGNGSFNPSNIEATTLEMSSDGNAKEETWGLPIDGGAKDELFDYEGVKYDDMEFEPQTYFTYTELLATDDDKLDDMDPSCNWDNSGGYTMPSTDLPEQYKMDAIQNQEFIGTKEAVLNVPCQMCSHTEPAPDLVCEICGICIHNHCSPWVETDWEERWRCGNCRDWR